MPAAWRLALNSFILPQKASGVIQRLPSVIKEFFLAEPGQLGKIVVTPTKKNSIVFQPVLYWDRQQ
jgi:hypothetical protein